MKYICQDCGKPTDNKKVTINNIVTHRCDKCEKLLTRQIEWVLKNKQRNENTIICPYCDYEYYSSSYNEEGYYTVECPSCGKKFDLEVEEVRYFSTNRNIDEMPKDWDGDEE